jgi:serine/threonine protein phosphatase PrpC
MLKINFSGKTDAGLKRPKNEDTYRIEPDLGFCLVADGLGGESAGDIASRIFSETIAEVFEHFGISSQREMAEQVKASFRAANENILAHVRKNPHHKGMGCTAELIAFSNDGFVLGHMGDSRTYRLRKGFLKQLTQDHSFVQDQVDKGLLTSKIARKHPMRHVILRAVGINEEPTLDLIRGPAHPEDQFLLCSDGLTDMVDDCRIQKTLSSSMALNQKVDHLIKMALSAGGIDNVTVVLVETR